MSTEHSPRTRGLSRRDLLRRGAVATAVASLGVAGIAGNASATKPKDAIPIDGPTTITEPGYYVLTKDIVATDEGSIIDIDPFENEPFGLGDVTIDGCGYTLDGDRKAEYGISLIAYPDASLTNLTIKDVCVTRCTWAGIQIEEVRSGLIENVTVTRCGSEFSLGAITYLQNSNVTLRDSLIKNNRNSGIYTTEGGRNNVFVRNRVTRNGSIGFIDEGSDFLFKDNKFDHNKYGLSLGVTNVRPMVVDNLFYKNGAGIEADFIIDAVIRGNRLVKNGEYGITLFDTAGVTIEKNEIHRTNGPGIILSSIFAFGENNISKNTITHNSGPGIVSRQVNIDSDPRTNTVIEKNTIEYNGDGGVQLTESNIFEIIKNTIRNNDGDGIELRDSDDNVIRKNVIKGNAGLPIRIDDESTGNVVEKNKTSGSGADHDSKDNDQNDGDEEICRVDSH
ncbi:right-handed parallel beta-helix repeat-containing protein [Haloferax sp. DFSO60]|uniref:right-handed parallel beta-helix repeat-containing protein n=1 Tax=Haloferax sp. DFSO60 TaxID=3388652 RepID=UPI003978D250